MDQPKTISSIEPECPPTLPRNQPNFHMSRRRRISPSWSSTSLINLQVLHLTQKDHFQPWTPNLLTSTSTMRQHHMC